MVIHLENNETGSLPHKTLDEMSVPGTVIKY